MNNALLTILLCVLGTITLGAIGGTILFITRKYRSRDKWDPRQIHFEIGKDNELIFNAMLCIQWGMKDKKTYREKDMALVERLIGHIKLHKLAWWEVKENKKHKTWSLYYYPLRWFKETYKDQDPANYSFSLSDILDRFNWMVKE